MGERSATGARPARHGRRLAAAALAGLGALALALGAGHLISPPVPPAVSPLPRLAPSSAARPVGALAARFTGPLPVLPPGSVPVSLAAVSLPVGARLVLPTGPGPVLLGVEVGAVSAQVGGSMVLLAATPDAVAPPFQVAMGGATAGSGSGAVLVAPAGEVIELANVGTAPAAGAFVAFGTATFAAPDSAALHLVASGQLDPPSVHPLRVEVTRWSLVPGAIMPAHAADGPELLAVAAGSVIVTAVWGV